MKFLHYLMSGYSLILGQKLMTVCSMCQGTGKITVLILSVLKNCLSVILRINCGQKWKRQIVKQWISYTIKEYTYSLKVSPLKSSLK